MRHTLNICASCSKTEDVSHAVSVLQSSLHDFEVRASNCMNMCDAPNSVSFRAVDKAAYLFAGVDLSADQNDIIAFAKLYSASADGWIDDATPCGRLRFCLVGRIPA